jgi:protein phosphatase 2C family protein 2/3
MAPGTNASLQIERLDGGCGSPSKGSASATEDENLDNLNQLSAGKPPRNIKIVRHCSSSAFFTDFVS